MPTQDENNNGNPHQGKSASHPQLRRLSRLAGGIPAMLAVGIVIGAAGSMAAIGFTHAVNWLNDALFISLRSRADIADATRLAVITVAVPAIGGLVVGLILTRIREGRAHAPPDAIEAAHQVDSRMPVRSGLLTAAAALIGLGSGASVGQYGPIVHLGATLGSVVARVRRDLGVIGIGCGVAAGISTAFSAPIAGILFAHEVILRHYSWRAFAPVTIASAVGVVVGNFLFQQPVLLPIGEVKNLHAVEYLVFSVIGIAGALVAVTFMRSVLAAGELAQRTRLPLPARTTLAGAFTGIIAIWLPDILSTGTLTLRLSIMDLYNPLELSAILVAKLVATAVCLGFGFAGGVFSPALVLGTLFGALVGNGMEAVAGDAFAHVAVYGICGMAAVTSAVMGAPITTILIVFEITRNYELTTAAMVSVVLSNLVASRTFGRSLFDVQLLRRGFDVSGGREQILLRRTPISSCVSQEFTAVTPAATLRATRSRMLAEGRSDAYVLNPDGGLLGVVTLNRLLTWLRDPEKRRRSAGELAEEAAVVLRDDMSVWDAMEKLEDFVGDAVPVLSREDGRSMVGVVHETSVLRAFLRVSDHVREEEHDTG